MKIVTVLGARPQFIKAGTVSRVISSYSDIKEIIIHTGQHYDSNMSEVFFDELKIPKPTYNLGISSINHGAMTGRMLEEIESILIKEKPDYVLVYGDTNSTLAGALAAAKLQIKVAHVEAGLRSYNTKMPEEINRVLTDNISSLLFCPTESAVSNLNNEGIESWGGSPKKFLVGDVMQDGAFFYSQYASKPVDYDISDQYVLCTIHRAENVDFEIKLAEIISALNIISERVQVVLPLHPRTKNKLLELDVDLSNLLIMSPLGYLNMIWLIKNSVCVITDSGGLQKEAFFFEKICLTTREETEWVELVERRVNFLVGTSKKLIIDTFNNVESMNVNFDQSIYGDGLSSHKIIAALLDDYGARL